MRQRIILSLLNELCDEPDLNTPRAQVTMAVYMALLETHEKY